MKFRIAWLYPAQMNIYGDRGNVIALRRRAEWRGFDVQVDMIGIGDPVAADVDCFFFGGGQDQEQRAVSEGLQGDAGQAIRDAVDDGAALLAVCGGYQLLGHVYRPFGEEPLAGIGVFDAETEAGPERFIGNVVAASEWGDLVGFENHSGLTRLGTGTEAMATVRVGRGNNGEDGTEGARYKNAVGCYLHGSLLPKNPRLADWLIKSSLERHGDSVELMHLDDRFELDAHDSSAMRARRTR